MYAAQEGANTTHWTNGLRFLFSLPTKAALSATAAYEKRLCLAPRALTHSILQEVSAETEVPGLLQAQEAQQWPVEQEPGAELTTPYDGSGRLMQERAGGAERQQSRAD